MKLVKISGSSDLVKVALDITGDTVTFGDEVQTVVGHLTDIRDNAETFGVEYREVIPDMYGGYAEIVAYPSRRRHVWHF